MQARTKKSEFYREKGIKAIVKKIPYGDYLLKVWDLKDFIKETTHEETTCLELYGVTIAKQKERYNQTLIGANMVNSGEYNFDKSKDRFYLKTAIIAPNNLSGSFPNYLTQANNHKLLFQYSFDICSWGIDENGYFDKDLIMPNGSVRDVSRTITYNVTY